MYITDSSYYDWPARNPERPSLLDVFQYQKVVDDIGRLQTDEAFCVLSLPYVFAENRSNNDYQKRDDMSPFHGLLSVIKANGGRALNTHFLHNRVQGNGTEKQFEQEVWRLAKALWPARVKQLTLCERLEGEAYSQALLRNMNPHECDSAVLAVIHNYINKKGDIQDDYSLDSIMMDLYQLPNFLDGIADDCVEKKGNHNYTRLETQIGVHYKMPPLYPWDNYTVIERVYTIIRQPRQGQTKVNVDYGNQFISKTRLLCNED